MFLLRFLGPEHERARPSAQCDTERWVCRPFLSHCELQFEFQASAFLSDRAEVDIISYLSGWAKAWATAEWSHRSAICNSLPLFVDTFKTVFQSVTPGREAAKSLVALKQGRRSVLDYAIEFRTLAANSSWNQPALVDAFYNGLMETIKDHLTSLDLPSELDALVSLVSRIDKRLMERRCFSLTPAPMLQGPVLRFASGVTATRPLPC